MTKVVNKKDKILTERILEGTLRKVINEQNERNLVVFATKQELKEEIKKLEERQNWKFNELLIASEKIYAKLEKKELEGAAHHYMHKSAEDRLADHDKRLVKLERPSA